MDANGGFRSKLISTMACLFSILETVFKASQVHVLFEVFAFFLKPVTQQSHAAHVMNKSTLTPSCPK